MGSPRSRSGPSAALRHRINAGRVAVEAQTGFFAHQFGQVASEWKADDTRVTFADFAISEKVFSALRKDFPEDDYCSEESNPLDETQELESRFAWVIDPIDGTNNYARGNPSCAISLALLEKGWPVYGFVYDFSKRELLEGGRGSVLCCDRQRVDRQKATEDPQTLIGLHFPLPEDEARKVLPLITRHRIRCFGSSALLTAYVATGYLDGTLDTRVRVWDIAAAYALCESVGVPFRFIGDSPFPLERFSPTMGGCPFYAGSPAFCEEVGQLLGVAGDRSEC